MSDFKPPWFEMHGMVVNLFHSWIPLPFSNMGHDPLTLVNDPQVENSLPTALCTEAFTRMGSVKGLRVLSYVKCSWALYSVGIQCTRCNRTKPEDPTFLFYAVSFFLLVLRRIFLTMQYSTSNVSSTRLLNKMTSLAYDFYYSLPTPCENNIDRSCSSSGLYANMSLLFFSSIGKKNCLRT